MNPTNIQVTRSTFWINPVEIANQIKNEIVPKSKNFFEVKSAKSLTLDGNDFTGFPSNFAFTVRNQVGDELGYEGSASPWATIDNVIIRNNRFQNVSQAYGSQLFSMQLEDNNGTSLVGGNFVIENNLFTTGGWSEIFLEERMLPSGTTLLLTM